MVKFINSWAQGIILAVILATIIEIILPEGNNKKYVKTIIGIYMLFVIIYPIISKISGNKLNVESIVNSASATMDEYQINNNITLETDAYVEKIYQDKMEKDIKERLKEKGYNVNSLNLYLELENEDRYGEINSMVMKISKLENSNNETNTMENKVNTVQEININISKNDNTTIEEEVVITEEEINSLKAYLNTIYSIEKEKIHINE